MNYLTFVLLVKISVTFILVVLPFLCFPQNRIEKIVSVKAASPLLMRLYGVSILALLVGYSSALPAARAGVFPWGIVLMALVSNAGASVFLFKYGQGKQNKIAGTFYSLITVLLIVAIVFPDFAVGH